MTIAPHPSRYLLILLIIIYLGAIFCVHATDLPLFIKGPIVIISSIYFYYLIKRYVLLDRKNSIICASINADQQWQLQFYTREWMQAKLMPRNLVTRYFIILNFKVAEKKCGHALLLFPDSISRDELRKLRAYLFSYRG